MSRPIARSVVRDAVARVAPPSVFLSRPTNPQLRGLSSTSRSTAGTADVRQPRTTYESGTDLIAQLQKLNPCRKGGFNRANFVVQGGYAEDLKKNYCIGKLLGSGATANVFRAVNQRTGQEVAVKVICKRVVTDQQMLQNEIQIHKATDHPNILRLLETFEDETNHYLVTELCEGGDLWHHMVSNSDEYSTLHMSEDDALRLFRQAVNSVRYLHSRGIAHRDLKPGNFLFRTGSSEGETGGRLMRLTDFGVSAYCGGRHRLTRTVGTERFIAPEVLRNQPYDEKADIFSLGCILHMLITGHPPKLKADNTYATSRIRLQFASEGVRDLVARLMQPEPRHRPSAEELSQMPILQGSRTGHYEKSQRLDSHLLDQLFAYSKFPLLKKAALVAMVSRADSDADFMPMVESFMALDRGMKGGLVVSDVFEALKHELLGDLQAAVRRTLAENTFGVICKPGRRQRQGVRLSSRRFQDELHSDLEGLLRKIDTSGEGRIGYSEWLAATVDPAWYTAPQRIASAFRLLDVDGDGTISKEDLKKVLPDVFSKLTVEAVLQESQLSATQASWIREEHFALLIQTQNASSFTLRRIAQGVEDPLVGAD